MAKPHGSVRIGPISLFTLIIILCLAVLAVLSVTTARAELSITERQATTTTETYELESAAQRFVAEVDRALGAGDAALAAVLADYGIVAGSDATPAAGETIEDDTMVAGGDASAGTTLDDTAISVDGTFDGTLLSATFSLESGRTLAAVLRINDNGTYTIEQWKTTTQWTDDGTGANLWLG